MKKSKIDLLKEKIACYTSENVMVAFSGGVDSALLLKLVCDAAGEKNISAGQDEPEKENGRDGRIRVYAATVRTRLHPADNSEKAARLARELGAIPKILETDELEEAGIAENPKNRCYLCKKSIFGKMKKLAGELSVSRILEGTNGDDLHQYRPGIAALQELGIISPLAEAGLTKQEIRVLAGELGLSVSDKPSAPCLATRLPYGERIDYSLLAKIDEGEEYLRKLGFYNVRIRVHRAAAAGFQEGELTGSTARIEVDEKDFQKLLERKQEITDRIKRLGFSYVTLDLEGFRSGSMDL